MHFCSLWALWHLSMGAVALQLLPLSGRNFQLGDSVVINWTLGSGDPENISIAIQQQFSPFETRELASKIDVNDLKVTVHIPSDQSPVAEDSGPTGPELLYIFVAWDSIRPNDAISSTTDFELHRKQSPSAPPSSTSTPRPITPTQNNPTKTTSEETKTRTTGGGNGGTTAGGGATGTGQPGTATSTNTPSPVLSSPSITVSTDQNGHTISGIFSGSSIQPLSTNSLGSGVVVLGSQTFTISESGTDGVSPTQNVQDPGGSGSRPSHLGAIIGGAVGGAVALALLALLCLLLRRRTARKNNVNTATESKLTKPQVTHNWDVTPFGQEVKPPQPRRSLVIPYTKVPIADDAEASRPSSSSGTTPFTKHRELSSSSNIPSSATDPPLAEPQSPLARPQVTPRSSDLRRQLTEARNRLANVQDTASNPEEVVRRLENQIRELQDRLDVAREGIAPPPRYTSSHGHESSS